MVSLGIVFVGLMAMTLMHKALMSIAIFGGIAYIVTMLIWTCHMLMATGMMVRTHAAPVTARAVRQLAGPFLIQRVAIAFAGILACQLIAVATASAFNGALGLAGLDLTQVKGLQQIVTSMLIYYLMVPALALALVDEAITPRPSNAPTPMSGPGALYPYGYQPASRAA
jgi:hypothetical protein